MDVATGMNLLHHSNIVHRDLKTDNIFVSLNEWKELACCAIGDMDIAKKLGKGVKAKTVCNYFRFLFLFLFYYIIIIEL